MDLLRNIFKRLLLDFQLRLKKGLRESIFLFYEFFLPFLKLQQKNNNHHDKYRKKDRGPNNYLGMDFRILWHINAIMKQEYRIILKILDTILKRRW